MYRWCTLNCEYLHKFSKKCKMTLCHFQGLEGKGIHEKNPEAKNLVTLSLLLYTVYIKISCAKGGSFLLLELVSSGMQLELAKAAGGGGAKTSGWLPNVPQNTFSCVRCQSSLCYENANKIPILYNIILCSIQDSKTLFDNVPNQKLRIT